MGDRSSSRVEQILQLLSEELEERQRAREQRPVTPDDAPAEAPRTLAASIASLDDANDSDVPEPALPAPAAPDESLAPRAPRVAGGAPHTARMLGRLALGLLVAIVVINIPLSRHGTTLATAMPDSASMVLRDGLVVKEAGAVEIYVYQDDRFRWISSLEAFEHYGFTWEDVHVVEDGSLDQFEFGAPLHVLLKCDTSPHIYRLEAGAKRWIVDIQAFEAEGHVWEDVRLVPCQRLRNLPDGDTIPPGQGPPPQP